MLKKLSSVSLVLFLKLYNYLYILLYSIHCTKKYWIPRSLKNRIIVKPLPTLNCALLLMSMCFQKSKSERAQPWIWPQLRFNLGLTSENWELLRLAAGSHQIIEWALQSINPLPSWGRLKKPLVGVEGRPLRFPEIHLVKSLFGNTSMISRKIVILELISFLCLNSLHVNVFHVLYITHHDQDKIKSVSSWIWHFYQMGFRWKTEKKEKEKILPKPKICSDGC